MKSSGAAMAAVVGLLLSSSTLLAADKQIRPYLGGTFAGSTTFADLDKAVDKKHVVLGVTAVTLGEIFGVDVDLGDAPGFFQAGDQHLVLSSRVTTLTGNLVVAAPRRLTEYILRPYLLGGAGLMRVRYDDYFGALKVASVLPGWDVGAGAIGFFTNDVGVSWEVRRFQSLSRQTDPRGLTLAPQTAEEQLSFWRVSVALAIRY